jgi:hypothetical protein
MSTDTTTRLRELGFSLDTTGGGCTAYMRSINDGEHYLMVTDNSGCGVDDIDSDNWIVGMYESATDSPITIHYADGGKIDSAILAAGVTP